MLSTLAEEGPLDGGHTAVIVLEEHGRVDLWNLASDRLLRRAAGDAVGESILSIEIPNLPDDDLQRVRTSAVAKTELRIDGRDGSWSRIAVLPLVEGRVAIVLHAI